MTRLSKTIITTIISGLSFSAMAEILTPTIESDYRKRLTVIEQASKLQLAGRNLSKDQEECMKMLYAYMPLPDMTDRTPEYYLEYVVDPALQARAEMPWGAEVDDALFRHFVLPVRVNNEALDRHRPQFYAELKDRVNGLSMKDAILEVNHWCHEKATYQPSDGRTHSPLQTLSSAIGRCGEESTFTVAALRSVGIPARQVYTPRWAHTDDNHAWVEAWADGEWYFLGACEPEPVLNLGWFNAPASRGMLMHARVFGNYAGTEERLETIDGITFINVTDNYAPTDTITVKAIYPDGREAVDADASFRLYNYAEFYPIAEKKTDKMGEASLVAGLGDLLVWVTDGNNFGFSKASVGKDRTISVILDKRADTPFSLDLDVIPPVGSSATVEVSDLERKRNDMRLHEEDSIRNAYTGTFASEDMSLRLATEFDLKTPSLAEIMKGSRGNHAVISSFLRSLPPESREKGLLLLSSLSEKDLTDITPKVLADHITSIDFGSGALFGPYVMSPRIDMEELTPYRSFFESVIPGGEAEFYRKNPAEWVKWVRANVVADLAWYPEQIAMSPEAVWNMRHTSPKSRDIFFVAGARSFGIPARIDQVTGKTQWADASGKWIDAAFGEEDPDGVAECGGLLKMDYTPSAVIPDPKYYSHFTISKLENGKPELLNYPDFIGLSETFGPGETLDCGTYVTVTGQRMADGGVLAHMESISIEADTLTVPLTVRHDDSKVQVIGSFDSESLYLPKDDDKERSILSATGRGYYVLALLKPNHEPSNHVVRDIAEAGRHLDECSRPILLLTESPGFSLNLDDFPALPGVVKLGSDPSGVISKGIAEGINLSSDDLPVIIIADTFNRVVFLSQGYTIGIGDQIASILRRIE